MIQGAGPAARDKNCFPLSFQPKLLSVVISFAKFYSVLLDRLLILNPCL